MTRHRALVLGAATAGRGHPPSLVAPVQLFAELLGAVAFQRQFDQRPQRWPARPICGGISVQ